MAEEIIIKGRTIYPGIAEGEALVSPMPLMGWGNVYMPGGYTVERGHPLYEVPMKGKILVFPYLRGSGGFVMYGRMRKYGTQPAAMLITESVSVAVTTAMNLKEPVMTDFDIDPCKVIKTGDHVIVNADEGYVKIVRE